MKWGEFQRGGCLWRGEIGVIETNVNNENYEKSLGNENSIDTYLSAQFLDVVAAFADDCPRHLAVNEMIVNGLEEPPGVNLPCWESADESPPRRCDANASVDWDRHFRYLDLDC
jgi:hypothetical protein